MASHKILYIDDDENNASLLKRVLEADGYTVTLASNGLRGLVEADQGHPDLILLDIYMPGLSGHEVARQLRRMEHTRQIPILIVSASNSLTDRQTSVQVGCDGYIAKPIDVDHISEQVAAFL